MVPILPVRLHAFFITAVGVYFIQENKAMSSGLKIAISGKGGVGKEGNHTDNDDDGDVLHGTLLERAWTVWG